MASAGIKAALGFAAVATVIAVASSSKRKTMSVFGKRMAIVETALDEEGNSDASKYGAAPGVDWCGIFDLWVYHQNGILTDVEWAYAEDVSGDGRIDYGFLMVPPKALPMTNSPEPGDIAYFNRNQHHALVEDVRGDMIDLINGNGLGGKVTRSTVNRQEVAAFFSVAPYLRESVFPESVA